VTEWTNEAMAARLVRYADLVPCRTAFIDTRNAGSTDKENFTIIGGGVSESADQFVHITEPHGFHIGGARQPGGCVNSQHSHETAEVFVVHSGQWRLLFGPNREDGTLDIGPGDVVSVPTHMYRGFENIGDHIGFLWVVLGREDPGRVTWAPAVLAAAADNGLTLSKGGMLIDTSSGDYTLRAENGPENEQPPQLITPSRERLLECIVREGSAAGAATSPLAGDGVAEAGVIVPRATSDGFAAGPITGWWPHGFNLRRLTLQSGAYVPHHARAEAEVLFIQSGTLEVTWPQGSLMMGAGDTLTVPIGLQHAFRNTASVPCDVFVVRGSDDPAMPVFA
jgi:mannose-6-phosphate isomerase-like protein (cupin superfamily)